MTKEPTIRDVLDAMHVFSTHVDVQFTEIKQDIGILKHDVSGLKQDVSGLKEDNLSLRQLIAKLTARVDLIQETMVTKDYLEGRLAAFVR